MDAFLESEWIDDSEYEEIGALQDALLVGGESGPYRVELAASGVLLVHGANMTLVVASESARTWMLKEIGDRFARDFDGDIESWVYFERAMANPLA